MASATNVVRAVSSALVKQILLIATLITALVFTSLLLIIWSLAHYVSAWWWLLLLMYLPLATSATVVLLFAYWLSKRIYPVKLTKSQQRDVRKFTGKLSRLVEARGLGWWMFAFTSIRELITYRELRTVKTIMNDSSTIKSDFDHLSHTL